MFCFLVLGGIRPVGAFNGHVVREGPLTLTIGSIKEVTEYDVPREVEVGVKNGGELPLKVQLQMGGLVDEWYAKGESERRFEIAPGGEVTTLFHIAAGKGAFSALYPVHVYATFAHQGREVTAHAAQIFQTKFTSATPSSSPPSKTPAFTVGTPPAQLTETQRELLHTQARQAVKSRKTAGENEFVFNLKDDYMAVIILGPNGLTDAALAFGSGDHCVVFDGLQMSVLKHRVGHGPSQIMLRKLSAKMDKASGRLLIRHWLTLANEEFELTAKIWSEQSGLRIHLECPKRITDMALGRADQKAPRVYYGHGYCIVEPQALRAMFQGHRLSTSHVGFDFEKGISLLIASDNPPDYLQVKPGQRLYALHTHLNATMTFVPSLEGAFDCARKYRPLYDKKPSAGLCHKAGRFVFDIWYGSYAENAQMMKRMVAYGLTDSMLTFHQWQRWGYDYRLPDIYPPNPELGTIDDMRQIAKVCTEHDILWGLHDNYIDFYPDAADYSYDHICFTSGGTPRKAYINKGRNAQSYLFRPDHIMPFVKRNLKLIKENLKPTHYFIDVFASRPCSDYYDRDGNFHSMLQTRRCWGEVFAWIRNYLGGNTVTTSEAGHDQLVGYLDGADCQHLTISTQGGWPYNRLSSKDWERVPWFDMVLHDKFSLHGVGYTSRYKLTNKNPQRNLRPIESDDYISAEILEGHALMFDDDGWVPLERGVVVRGSVRKYWLAQDFIRSIALDTIKEVEFVEGDIHRQIITWNSGAKVFVNRGSADWVVAGKTLSQYGYFAKNGPIESSIEKVNGIVVEQSRGPLRYYVNARWFHPGRNQEINSPPRENEKRMPIDFGVALTAGAFRCEIKGETVVVTPLPEIGPFTISLRMNKLTGNRGVQVKSVTVVDADGRIIRRVKFDTKGDILKFQTRKNEFAYRILWRKAH